MDKVFEVAVGSAATDQQLEFRALSVQIDNPTNQWVSLDSLGVAIPQYTIGATYPLPGTQRARFSFTAPAGQTNPPIIAGQGIAVTFYDVALPSTAGVGMLGGRAPYYDRNPLSVRQQGSTAQNANSGSVFIWSYTVPAGRKAYVEVGFVATTITTAYANDSAAIETILAAFNSSGGGGTALVNGLIIIGTAIGTDGRAIVGASIELQAGESVQAQSRDARAAGAGASLHYASMKATEFDA